MATVTAPTISPAINQIGHRWSKVAGFTYVAAWLVGLIAFGAGPAADATNAEVARYFADHRVTSSVQSLLIHGVAAVALYAVLTAVARTRASTRTAHVAGLVGVGLSLVQCVLDVWRSAVSTGSTTATLVGVIDRVDGFKMFAFAVMIGASITSLRAAGLIGRRMALAGTVTTGALIISGIAYAGAVEPLLVSATLSLALLLTWVGYLGVAAGRRTV